MVTKEVVVRGGTGLQSKNAAVFIQKASNFKSNIWIEKEERKANAKSMLGLLSLMVGDGMKVTLIAEGEDEEEAIQELMKYLVSNSQENC